MLGLRLRVFFIPSVALYHFDLHGQSLIVRLFFLLTASLEQFCVSDRFISVYIFLGYSCQKDFSGFLVTTYKKHKNVSDFLGAMDSVFKDLTAVLDKREKSGSK